MSATEKADDQEQQRRAAGLSEFAGRLLQQLNISAWFPAAFLVSGLAVLLQMRRQPDSDDVVEAVRALSEVSFGTIVVLLLSLLLAALLIQAFSFEAIRALEGYWGSTTLATWVTRRRVARHLAKVRGLEKRRRDLIERMEAKAPKDRAADMAVVDALATRSEGYPAPQRLLPTMLGNTLRSYEDRVDANHYARLESLVIENAERLSEGLLDDHDHRRARLDMYCSMTLVSAGLALAGLLVLEGTEARVEAFTAFAAASWMSYRAANASAHAYGIVLCAIDRRLADARQTREQMPAASY